MQARSLGAILFCFGSVLDCGNTSHRVEDFGHMFELVGEIGLIQGNDLGMINSTLKISDFRPALSLRYGGIADWGGCFFATPHHRPADCR